MLRERLGEKKFERYYKFTFVRNPWARILSSYFWRQGLPKKRPVLPFSEFVENVREVVTNCLYYHQEFADHFIPQVEFTRDANDIFRFEEFESGVNTLAARFGILIDKVPQKKPRHYDNYWEFYNDDTRSLIADIYHEEIDEFGFEFGSGDDGFST